jgi:dienelactone hydrolase
VAQRIRQDVLILAGEDDQFVPVEQVDQYRSALVNARSITTRVYDRASGGAEHSQMGAPTLWQADLFDWLSEKFPQPSR